MKGSKTLKVKLSSLLTCPDCECFMVENGKEQLTCTGSVNCKHHGKLFKLPMIKLKLDDQDISEQD